MSDPPKRSRTSQITSFFPTLPQSASSDDTSTGDSGMDVAATSAGCGNAWASGNPGILHGTAAAAQGDVPGTSQDTTSIQPNPVDSPSTSSLLSDTSESLIPPGTPASDARAREVTQSDLAAWGKPCQPDAGSLPVWKAKNQNIRFQHKWYSDLPWLHYLYDVQRFICYTCSKAHEMGLLDLAKAKDPAFISAGFGNWKKATESFAKHWSSNTHRFATGQMAVVGAGTVVTKMDVTVKKEQEGARQCLVKLVGTVRFLLRQGLAFRGHEATEGNFTQLLNLRAEDDPVLKRYLLRVTNYTSPTSQEEMAQIISHGILRTLVEKIKVDGDLGIMVDGTQDITGTEQQSFCIRHVDSDLEVHEDFIGLYEVSETTGSAMSAMVADVIIRLGLSFDNLRAQTYDGASNMSGCYNGCQAKVKERQPLALYFHCGSHMANLVLQRSVEDFPLIRDAVSWFHELGVLLTRSRKARIECANVCADIADSEESPNIPAIRPLCPTRWLCRFKPVQSAVDSYWAVLKSLRQIADITSAEVATKARGLLDRFESRQTLLGLMIVARPLAVLEQLNSALQAHRMTVPGMLAAVKVAVDQLERWRSQTVFEGLLAEMNAKADQAELEPLQLPRRQRPPRRLAGNAEAYHPQSAEEYFRIRYYEFIDSLRNTLAERFDVNKSGLSEYKKLEDAILLGAMSDELLAKYHDFDRRTVNVQLQMFKDISKATTVHQAKLAYRKMSIEVRALFPQVLRLLKLLHVCPVTSCECERSFSCLKRLKTWLRNTMSQQRLNYTCVCNVHKDLLDTMDIIEASRTFAARSQTRKNLFGKFD